MSAGFRRAPFSYRDDPNVPPFPNDKPLIVFDGVCVLCSGFVSFVIAQDRAGQFRFASAQSALGQALYRHYGLSTESYETNLVIVGGVLHEKWATVSAVLSRLGGARPLLAALIRTLPKGLGDWLYDRIAKNRYRLFGRRDACLVPSPAVRARFLTD